MPEDNKGDITISIVSHGQGNLVASLLEDLSSCRGIEKIILTLNIPEPDIQVPEALQGRLQVIHNNHTAGFGENHNSAFEFCDTRYFVVLNPDIRIDDDPFPDLSLAISGDKIGVVAPAVMNPDGDREDNARFFPTMLRLMKKIIGFDDGSIHPPDVMPTPVDWLAGMFLFFRSDVFGRLGGFDERFFLYYEDVDISIRLWRHNLRVILCPSKAVIHNAQRASRRKIRYMLWHVTSMLRYLAKHTGRLPR